MILVLTKEDTINAKHVQIVHGVITPLYTVKVVVKCKP